MCGITGFIGHSKNPPLSNKLISDLFSECESRGVDASGFWAVEKSHDQSSSVYFHKEPVKASEFVAKQPWKDLSYCEVDLLIAHARGASTGVGGPHINKNNHPFISADKSIGLIHNGRIHEYDDLVKQYEVSSSCDSEILLRIFEGGNNYHENQINLNLKESHDEIMAKRLMGLRDIWSYIDRGHMAVAIGERVNATDRRLFLFRNKHRPLWIADCIKDLGQVFFVSTPEIWTSAYKSSGALKLMKHTVRLIEVPTEQLWILSTTKDEPIVKKIDKYTIKSTGKVSWEPTPTNKIKIHNGICNNGISLISRLNEREEVKYVQDTVKKNTTKNTIGFHNKPIETKKEIILSGDSHTQDDCGGVSCKKKEQVKKELVQDFSHSSANSGVYRMVGDDKKTNVLYEVEKLRTSLTEKVDKLCALFKVNYLEDNFTEIEAVEVLSMIESLEIDIDATMHIVNKNNADDTVLEID